MSRKTPIVRDAATANAYRDEYRIAHEGARQDGLLDWARRETLADDIPDIEKMLEAGDSVAALDHVGAILGMDAIELMGVLGPENQNRAGLIGYIRGLLDGSETPSASEWGRQRVDIDFDVDNERPRRRRLYG